MGLPGVSTTNISNRVSVADEVVVNRDGSTAVQQVDALAVQLLAGPIGTEIEDKMAAAATGLKSAKTWPELLAVVGSATLQKGEVITDAGTHTDPVVGGTVPNKGSYSWSVSPAGWKRTGDLIDASSLSDRIEDTNALIKGSSSSEVVAAFTDKFGFSSAAFTLDGALETNLFAVREDGYNGVVFTDKLGFVLARFGAEGSHIISLDGGDTPASSDITPYFGPNLFGWSGEVQKIYLARLFGNRDDANSCRVTILGETGHSDSSDVCLTFRPADLGASASLTAWPRSWDGSTRAELSLSVIVAPNPPPAATAPVILCFGDSNSQAAGQFLKPELETRGYSPVFIGTRTFGGVQVEGRSGWESGDVTFAVTDKVTPVEDGGFAAYNAMTDAAKLDRNPYLRLATGGDAAGDIVNGRVLDFERFRIGTGLGIPDIAPYGYITNDVRDRTLDEIYSTTYTNDRLVYRRLHAAWPNLKILRWFPVIPVTPDRDALMPSYKAYWRGAMDAIRDHASPKVFLVPTWVAAPPDAGFALAAGSVDLTTGVKMTSVNDPLHQIGGSRLMCFRILAAAIAAAARNLI
ncbi:SGNH/GDSL hydrolase family protein [Pararhizobium sp.]|uniref:SGNH/GDSL hydrolase family protein n=1 Tax=Pararhizobium sp. TaxID=1977563 RepID=UPI003D1406F4